LADRRRRLLGGSCRVRGGRVLIGTELTIRRATPADVDTLVELIRGLAEFERLTDILEVTADRLAEDLFGARPVIEAMLAERDGTAIGYAIFHPTYSTFRGRPGLYLEDIFVREEARGSGAGVRLLAEVAALARSRGCHQVSWVVLDWNRGAIDFYERLGAEPSDGDWLGYALSGEALERLASTI
jgi:GNAT superfamily N-acetyltransferase